MTRFGRLYKAVLLSATLALVLFVVLGWRFKSSDTTPSSAEANLAEAFLEPNARPLAPPHFVEVNHPGGAPVENSEQQGVTERPLTGRPLPRMGNDIVALYAPFLAGVPAARQIEFLTVAKKAPGGKIVTLFPSVNHATGLSREVRARIANEMANQLVAILAKNPGVAAVDASPNASRVEPSRTDVLATVNSFPVTRAEFAQRLKKTRAQLRAPLGSFSPGTQEAIERCVLDTLLEEALWLERSEALGVSVTQEQLKRQAAAKTGRRVASAQSTVPAEATIELERSIKVGLAKSHVLEHLLGPDRTADDLERWFHGQLRESVLIWQVRGGFYDRNERPVAKPKASALESTRSARKKVLANLAAGRVILAHEGLEISFVPGTAVKNLKPKDCSNVVEEARGFRFMCRGDIANLGPDAKEGILARQRAVLESHRRALRRQIAAKVLKEARIVRLE